MGIFLKRETLIFFTLILILSANFSRFSFEDNSNKIEKDLFEPIILIHDVSPVYLDDLKEIDEVISKYGYSKRTYLFLIVNHANVITSYSIHYTKLYDAFDMVITV